MCVPIEYPKMLGGDYSHEKHRIYIQLKCLSQVDMSLTRSMIRSAANNQIQPRAQPEFLHQHRGRGGEEDAH